MSNGQVRALGFLPEWRTERKGKVMSVTETKVKPMPFQKRKARQMKYYCGFCHCSSVAKSCLTFWAPVDCNTADIPAFTISQSLLKIMSIGLKRSSNHFILCHPLLLLPSIFPSIRVFSNELALHIRWPKSWSFSLSLSPSNEYSGLISLRIDWFDLLAVQVSSLSLCASCLFISITHQCPRLVATLLF